MKPPRNGDELIAHSLNVSPATAAAYRRRLGANESFTELDAMLRAAAAASDLEAVKSVDSEDVAELATRRAPLEELDALVERRSERELRARLAAHVSWAKTPNRAARTAKGRAAFEQRFLDEADGDPVRAAHLRKAYFLRLALKSAQARRRKK